MRQNNEACQAAKRKELRFTSSRKWGISLLSQLEIEYFHRKLDMIWSWNILVRSSFCRVLTFPVASIDYLRLNKEAFRSFSRNLSKILALGLHSLSLRSARQHCRDDAGQLERQKAWILLYIRQRKWRESVCKFRKLPRPGYINSLWLLGAQKAQPSSGDATLCWQMPGRMWKSVGHRQLLPRKVHWRKFLYVYKKLCAM